MGYKDEFKAKQVHNPAYVEDGQLHAFDSISRVSFELWTVNNGTIFDNIVVCDNLAYAKSFAEKTWGRTRKEEAAAKAKWEKESKTQDDNVRMLRPRTATAATRLSPRLRQRKSCEFLI